jgi:hypothetical protein
MQLGDDGTITGSHYFSDEFEMGKILLEGNWYDSTLLKYDIYNSCFEIQLSNDIFVLDPIQNYADSIYFKDEIFIRKDVDPGPKIKLVYLSLLTDNKSVSLCKMYRIRLDPPKQSDGYTEGKLAAYVSNSPRYYIFRENERREVEGLKSIAEMFNTDSKTIKAYMKENKYKISREQDLISIINHLSE